MSADEQTTTESTGSSAASSSPSGGAGSSIGKILGIAVLAAGVGAAVVGYTFWQEANKNANRQNTIIDMPDENVDDAVYEADAGGGDSDSSGSTPPEGDSEPASEDSEPSEEAEEATTE